MSSMTIFATEQAFNAPAVAYPDFAAGFIYGMTGDNHLTEIQACYQGGEELETDVKDAIAQIKSGKYIKGFKELSGIVGEFKSALSTCENMDDDLHAIESWATIFTKPVELIETLGKHWLFHGKTIKEDLGKEKTDWDADKYFEAGVDIAMAFTQAVGPIESSSH